MQNNRLFEIVYLLLSRQSTTAKELAEHFEVSTRTIYRDIEALSGSGIPIYMCQGKGGGIHLMDQYILNKTILSEEEQNDILSALQGISATTGEDSKDLMTKLSGMFCKEHENWIEVDFNDWSGQEQDKFNQIKQAILCHNVITFHYYGRNGKPSNRKVKPLKLYFRDKTWYLNGYCMEKNAMRLFKLRRMKEVVSTKEEFQRLTPMEQKESLSNEINTSDAPLIRLVLEIDASLAYRVYDEFLEDQIEVIENQNFRVTAVYPEDDWVYGLILSYGSHIKVIEPEQVKRVIVEELERGRKRYE